MSTADSDVVYVVLRNDKLDEVFDNEHAAKVHAHNLMKRWNIATIVECPVRTW